jgi:hypothetical protein
MHELLAAWCILTLRLVHRLLLLCCRGLGNLLGILSEERDYRVDSLEQDVASDVGSVPEPSKMGE